MRDGIMRLREKVQTLLDALLAQDVVYRATSEGEPLFELYSLLDALEPDESEAADRLRRVRFVLTQHEGLGLYLVYIPLPDVLVHLVPCSMLPEARALQGWLSRTRRVPSHTPLYELFADLGIALQSDTVPPEAEAR